MSEIRKHVKLKSETYLKKLNKLYTNDTEAAPLLNFDLYIS